MRPLLAVSPQFRWRATIAVAIGVLVFGVMLTRLLAWVVGDPLPQQLALIEMPMEISTTDIAVQPGGYAYVLNETTDSIAVLDGPQLVTLMRIKGPEGERAGMTDIAVHPQTGLVYVTDILQGLHIIRGTEVITTIADPDARVVQQMVTIHPVTGYVYTGPSIVKPGIPETLFAVRVISGTQVITDIAVSSGILSMAPDPRNGLLYVGHALSTEHRERSLIDVIDGTRLVTTTMLDIDPKTFIYDVGIEQMIVNARTGERYLLESINNVTYWSDDQVERVRFKVDYDYGSPQALGWDPKREIVYAGVLGLPYALALRKNREPVELRIVAGTMAFVYDKTHDYIYTADYNGPSMSVIRGTDVLATLSTGGYGPRDVGVDEERGYIYVSNADSHSVAVFGFDQPEQPSFWQRFLPFIGR